MITWKRVDDGLYQRFDDGVAKNIYIGRVTSTLPCGALKYIAWQAVEKVCGELKVIGCEYWNTLREAKKEMENYKATE